jgi:hypothetical protein
MFPAFRTVYPAIQIAVSRIALPPGQYTLERDGEPMLVTLKEGQDVEVKMQ